MRPGPVFKMECITLITSKTGTRFKSHNFRISANVLTIRQAGVLLRTLKKDIEKNNKYLL